MTLLLIDANASQKILNNKNILKTGSWGNGNETVCMMSALVKGATSADDCVVAGWPQWLAELNTYLFDAEVGADDENQAAFDFALAVAKAVEQHRDYDRASNLFLISRLKTGEYSALKSLDSLSTDWPEQRQVILNVVELLQQRLDGKDVSNELAIAKEAARAAAASAADASRAARAAARAAADAARAADAATAAAAVAWTATAAVWAAAAAARTARAAAAAAARVDLIAALLAS